MSARFHRGRRLRRTAAMRELVAETRLSAAHLVAPLFVCDGHGRREPIPSMSGQARLSPDLAALEAAALSALGIRAVLLFGVPSHKDGQGSGAWSDDGPVPRAIESIKVAAPEMAVWADVCLCEYTDHGHCGVLDGSEVDNDASLPLLSQAALTYVRAGADVIAPSDMMAGRVAATRSALDSAGFVDRAIVSYAVKYASAFYGFFRETAVSLRRAGAAIVITYFAKPLAIALSGGAS